MICLLEFDESAADLLAGALQEPPLRGRDIADVRAVLDNPDTPANTLLLGPSVDQAAAFALASEPAGIPPAHRRGPGPHTGRHRAVDPRRCALGSARSSWTGI